MKPDDIRQQLIELRRELIDRDDYASRRRLAEIEAMIAAIERCDGVRRELCAP